MRKIATLLSMLSMAMASVAAAQPNSGGGGVAPPACPIPNDPVLLLETLWPLADTDDDNKLNAAEIDALYAGGSELLLEYGDSNNDGKVSFSEAKTLLVLLPIDFLGYVDTNGDQLLSFDEVSEYATREQFDAVDVNDNGILDCGDVGDATPEGEVLPEGEDVVEGEVIVEGEPNGPCPLPRDFHSLTRLLWPVVDADASGGLTLAEVQKFYPELDADLFASIDIDASGEVTIEELDQIVVILGTGETNALPGPFVDLLGLLDTNANSLLEWNELSEYIDRETFDGLDANDNEVIDCGDFDSVEPEGQPEGQPDPDCSFVDFFANAFPSMDVDNNSEVTVKEFSDYAGMLGAPIDFGPAFHAADADHNEVVTLDELAALVARCGGIGGEEGEQPVYPCEFLWLFGTDAYPTYDANADQQLSFDELPVINFLVEPEVTPEEAFKAADFNQDTVVDAEEFASLLAQCGYGPVDPCSLIGFYGTDWTGYDADNNGKISFEELPMLAFPAIDNGAPVPDIAIYPFPDPAAMFAAADLNADTFIDQEELATLLANCGFEGEPEGGSEGQPEGLPEGQPEGDPTEIPLCALAPLLQSMFPLLDADDNGVVTLNELETIGVQVGVVYPDHAALFALADADNSGGITREEARRLVEECFNGSEGGNPGEGELEQPEGEIDPGWDEGVYHVERNVRGNGFYRPGEELVIETRLFARPPKRDLTPLLLEETLPEGWSLTRIIEASRATTLPEAGATGVLTFGWEAGQVLPHGVRVVYGLTSAEAEGPQVIFGHAISIGADGQQVHGPVTATAIGEGWSDEECHSGDFDHDWTFSLSELLRIVQLFNVGAFGCSNETEDGFRPGISIALNVCPPHAGDINADWAFELDELLRIIQFYNSENGAYQIAEDAATEDGFLPGMFELK